MAESASVPGIRQRTASSPSLSLERPGVLGSVLIAPAIFYIAVLVGWPFLLAVYLSMSNTDVATTGLGRFVGLDNFVALSQSDVFWVALRNTDSVLNCVGKERAAV